MGISLSKIFKGVSSSVQVGPARAIGIDVGASSVKVVELEDVENAIILKSYGELQLGPYGEKSLGEAVELESQKIVEAIVDVVREAGILAKEGVMAIPLSSSFMTVIPITAVTPEELASKIPVEARKYIPVPLPDMSLDWRELDSATEQKTNLHEVLIVAVENTALSRYRDLIRLTGLNAKPSEIEAFSSLRSLWKNSDQSVAVIDLGAKTSKLYIAKEGLLERVHRVSSGGALISKRIAEMSSVGFEEAENIKRTYVDGPEANKDILKATESVLERPLQEFKRIIDQYEIRTNQPLSRVILTGGVSTGSGTQLLIANLLNREVESADTFSKIAYPAFMEDTLLSISPSFHVATGAALRMFEESSK